MSDIKFENCTHEPSKASCKYPNLLKIPWIKLLI